MISAINSYNTNINLKGRRFSFSKHTPKSLPFEEFHFMPELKKNENPIKKFFKRMADAYKGIREAMKPENEIRDDATGITFEA